MIERAANTDLQVNLNTETSPIKNGAICSLTLLHLEQEAFEVLSLRVEQVGGMIRGLSHLANNPNFSIRICGSTKHDLSEKVAGNVL